MAAGGVNEWLIIHPQALIKSSNKEKLLPPPSFSSSYPPPLERLSSFHRLSRRLAPTYAMGGQPTVTVASAGLPLPLPALMGGALAGPTSFFFEMGYPQPLHQLMHAA